MSKHSDQNDLRLRFDGTFNLPRSLTLHLLLNKLLNTIAAIIHSVEVFIESSLPVRPYKALMLEEVEVSSPAVV
jgi:hypothetical protein